jgi:transcriptional regulator with XRE-family HTH domain
MTAIKKFTLWWQYDQGGTMRDLAQELGITTQTIYYWLRGSPVPLKHLKRIEELSRGIFTKEMIRPDIFQ